jgi:hypothetical protein
MEFLKKSAASYKLQATTRVSFVPIETVCAPRYQNLFAVQAWAPTKPYTLEKNGWKNAS